MNKVKRVSSGRKLSECVPIKEVMEALNTISD